VPPSADDDEIGSDLSSGVDDDRCRAAFDQSSPELQPTPLQSSCGLFEKGRSISPRIVVHVDPGDVAGTGPPHTEPIRV
jgi:hypothetical protein